AEAVADDDAAEAVAADAAAALGTGAGPALPEPPADGAGHLVGAGGQVELLRDVEPLAADRALRRFGGHDRLAEGALHLPAGALERLRGDAAAAALEILEKLLHRAVAVGAIARQELQRHRGQLVAGLGADRDRVLRQRLQVKLGVLLRGLRAEGVDAGEE